MPRIIHKILLTPKDTAIPPVLWEDDRMKPLRDQLLQKGVINARGECLKAGASVLREATPWVYRIEVSWDEK